MKTATLPKRYYFIDGFALLNQRHNLSITDPEHKYLEKNFFLT